MKSLNEHNNNAIETTITTAQNWGKPVKNGISCDHCGKELFDTNPSVTLTSNPPQKNVHCECCDFKGYRFL